MKILLRTTLLILLTAGNISYGDEGSHNTFNPNALGTQMRQSYKNFTGQDLGVLTSANCETPNVGKITCTFRYNPQMLKANQNVIISWDYNLKVQGTYLDGLAFEFVDSLELINVPRK